MVLFSRSAVLITCLFLTGAAYADRGPIVWNEGVVLSQESQKAIILHNGSEEILILGTEMKSETEAEILEFIPFPSEPEVSLAGGNPFDEIKQLIRTKGLVFENYEDFGKGGGSGGAKLPVEIRFSATVGLHDVTVVKINDVEHFKQWLAGFFMDKGISVRNPKLMEVYENAQDYLQRGYSYFVFDRVKIAQEVKFLEPLAYRFRTNGIYFPLKTSNLIGGTGAVEMIFVMPGSVTDDIWQHTRGIFGPGQDRKIRLSSSSKLYPEELKRIPGADSFFRGSKIYLQVLKYEGPYDFRDDFTYTVNELVPYAYRFHEESPVYVPVETGRTEFIPSLTPDERRDMREAFCPRKDSTTDFLSSVQIIGMDCWDYIAVDEYEVYDALFRSHHLPGIPHADVVLENKTIPKEYKGGNMDSEMDPSMVQSFKNRNKVAYALEKGFPDTGESIIRIRDEMDAAATGAGTGVSRAGFNEAGNAALVYVEHRTGPESVSAYFVVLTNSGGAWNISRFQSIPVH